MVTFLKALLKAKFVRWGHKCQTAHKSVCVVSRPDVKTQLLAQTLHEGKSSDWLCRPNGGHCRWPTATKWRLHAALKWQGDKGVKRQMRVYRHKGQDAWQAGSSRERAVSGYQEKCTSENLRSLYSFFFWKPLFFWKGTQKKGTNLFCKKKKNIFMDTLVTTGNLYNT